MGCVGFTSTAIHARRRWLLMRNSVCLQGRLRASQRAAPEPSQPKAQQAGPAALQLPWLGPAGPPLAAFLQQLQGIYTRELALTSGCFQFIWFVNALAYYGVVLLTTSVRGPFQTQWGQSGTHYPISHVLHGLPWMRNLLSIPVESRQRPEQDELLGSKFRDVAHPGQTM